MWLYCGMPLAADRLVGHIMKSPKEMNMKKFAIFFVCAALAGAAGCLWGSEKSAGGIPAVDAKVLDGWKRKVDAVVDSGSTWLASRLQMRWSSHATQEFFKGEFFAYAGGDSAPAPTVMMSGARSHATNYARPRLADLKAYASDDSRGMWLQNKSLPGQPYEWASIANTGNIIQSINNEIGGLAATAARIWEATGEEKYAEAAAEVFDTYLTGIYYKNMPSDLNHGHQQTLVGLQSFEVIHEDVLDRMTEIYRVLKPYLERTRGERIPIWEGAMKKWADVIEANGVPHNNWNFMQARSILKVALLLGANDSYADGKGSGYYLDKVLRESSIRQWSLPELASYGYDPATGIWAECGGYSMVVLNDFTDMAEILGREAGIDLVAMLPVILKAAEAFPQYLMPDGRVIGFGDTHPDRIKVQIYERLIANAERFGKPEQKERMQMILDKLNKGDYDGLNTPTFWAPNASWLVMRTGMDSDRSLMAALNGSEGNHMHANGISMELYGHGLRLAPDGGIGRTLYSGLDYLEYYSQFPAHNTVCVDGVSSYPVMKSNHPLVLRGLYPQAGAGAPENCAWRYAAVDFIEPETQSDQRRQLGIVSTSDSTGYYVDIFRSRRRDGQDKTHDYFYHNMGQRMALTGADGSDLGLQPTDELAFAGAHLYAYSYLFNKASSATAKDVKSVFSVDMPDGTLVEMTMWMKGEPERSVFKALSPMTEGLSRMPDMPYDIKEQPTLTYVARQRGEAWKRPFVAVFEPSCTASGARIEEVAYPEAKADADAAAVAVEVKLVGGRVDLVISSDSGTSQVQVGEVKLKGEYAVVSDGRWLLCGGTYLKAPGVEIRAAKPVDVTVWRNSDGKLQWESSGAVRVK